MDGRRILGWMEGKQGDGGKDGRRIKAQKKPKGHRGGGGGGRDEIPDIIKPKRK